MHALARSAAECLSWILAATALSCLARGALLFLAGLLVTAAARKLRPRHRAAIWLLVIAGTAVFSVVWTARPSRLIGLPPVRAPVAVPAVVTREEPPAQCAQTSASSLKRSHDPAPAPQPGLAGAAVVSLWIMGTLLLLSRLLVGGLRARKLRAGCSGSAPLDSFSPGLGGPSRRLAAVRVLVNRGCRIPFTFGIRRPRVVVPAGFSRWAGWKRRAVLLHELEHIRRRDTLANLLVVIACSILWFVPTAWVARRFLLREEELACDERVLQDGVRGVDYAAGIVEILHSAAGRAFSPVTATSLGSAGTIKARIRSILSWPQAGAAAWGFAGKLVAFTFFLALPVIAFLGADLEPLSRAPTTSLFEVVRAGTPRQVQEAIDRCADVNEYSPQWHTVPLRLAAAYNENPDVLTVLINAGADTRANTAGVTALMAAAWSNTNPRVIQRLLDSGVDVDSQNAEICYRTALMFAAEHNPNPTMLLALLEGGADAHRKGADGKTALDLIQHNYPLRHTLALKRLQEASR
jgi:beta-lactamase regulating signal transducer with metallopeptidase domain